MRVIFDDWFLPLSAFLGFLVITTNAVSLLRARQVRFYTFPYPTISQLSLGPSVVEKVVDS
jgi:hypothetical protein